MKKKLLTLLTICLLPLALLAGSGDVNGDGKINVADIVEIINYLNDNPSDKFIYAEADVNNDGYVDKADVEAAMNCILSINTSNSINAILIHFADGSGKVFFMEGLKFKATNSGFTLISKGFSYHYSLEQLRMISFVYSDKEGDVELNEKPIVYPTSSNGGFLVTSDYGETWNNFDRGINASFIRDENGSICLEVRYLDEPTSGYGFSISNDMTFSFHPSTLGNFSNDRRIITCQPSGDIIEIPIIGGNEDTVVEIKNAPSCIHRQSDTNDGIRKIRFVVDENRSVEPRKESFSICLDGRSFAVILVQPGCNAPSFAQQMEALKDLYNTTGGDNWYSNTNWLSDKPICKWHGVNNDIWGNDTIIGNYVLRLNLSSNNLTGIVPSSLSLLMPNVYMDEVATREINPLWSFELGPNKLYGKIPETVKNHPSWKDIGWNFVLQDRFCNNTSLDYTDNKLKTRDEQIELIAENSPTSVYDVLKQNEYTLVFHAGGLNDMDYYVSDERINMYYDYCNKGLGMVIYVNPYWELTYDAYREKIINMRKEGLPEGIKWVNSFGDFWQSWAFSSCLLDKEGNLVEYWLFNGFDPHTNEPWFNEKINSTLHVLLGEPEEHEKYSSVYTSTDYSRDGEIITLQNATQGKGIDLVFLGDGYVDRDMNEGGKYESTMREAMEIFFSVEPYTSLRDRFNVYVVKVVSQNEKFTDDCKRRIYEDDAVCFEYAQKIPDINMDNVAIVNIENTENSVIVDGYANLYEGSNCSVSHIRFGGANTVIVHEAGGHGIAKLIDEYIGCGVYDEVTVSDDERETFCNWIDNMHAKGWYGNVSTKSSPEEVYWSHMLVDDRYKDEVGIFQGAWMYPNDLWRPSEYSIMRDSQRYPYFNAPSREAIYKRVMQLSEGDGWTYDFEKFAAFDAPIREANRTALTRGKARGAETQHRRVESRPPTIYKGTWRDAGKCEKVEYNKKFDR